MYTMVRAVRLHRGFGRCGRTAVLTTLLYSVIQIVQEHPRLHTHLRSGRVSGAGLSDVVVLWGRECHNPFHGLTRQGDEKIPPPVFASLVLLHPEFGHRAK